MQLASISRSIILPGCTLHSTGLQIDGEPSDEHLKEIGQTLNAIEQCGLWWWGDYLQHIQRRKGEKYAEAIAESSYGYSALAGAKWVCGAFDLCSREQELSYTHHRECLSECDGDALKALPWLAKARENKWSVADMRKAIRLANATHVRDPKSKGQASPYDWVKELKLWTRTGMEQATPELRAQLKAELLEIADKL